MDSMEDEAQEVRTEENSSNRPTRPVVSFSGTGGLNVAVWKNKGDNEREYYSVRIDRSYKDESGSYKSAAYLRESDLLRAAKLLEAADDWIEQDKAKTRSSAASRVR